MSESETELNLPGLIEAFSRAKPTPAGGAGAALAVSTGAALGVKVIGITLRKRPDSSAAGELRARERELVRVASRARLCFGEDARAVRALLSANHGETASALEQAMRVPLEVLELARDGLSALETAIPSIIRTLWVDAAAGASLLSSGADISRWIVEHNAQWIPGERHGDDLRRRAEAAQLAAADSFDAIRSRVQ